MYFCFEGKKPNLSPDKFERGRTCRAEICFSGEVNQYTPDRSQPVSLCLLNFIYFLIKSLLCRSSVSPAWTEEVFAVGCSWLHECPEQETGRTLLPALHPSPLHFHPSLSLVLSLSCFERQEPGSPLGLTHHM